VGLIPENELSRMAGVALDPRTGGPYVDERLATSVPGIYAAGNVLHVYDLVDEVTRSALAAGRRAAEYARLGAQVESGQRVAVTAGQNVRHVIPQQLRREALRSEGIKLEFRVREPLECAVRAEVVVDEELIASQRLRYARPSEMIALEIRPSDLSARRHARLLEARECVVRVSPVGD
jgi:hypothetical protein